MATRDNSDMTTQDEGAYSAPTPEHVTEIPGTAASRHAVASLLGPLSCPDCAQHAAAALPTSNFANRDANASVKVTYEIVQKRPKITQNCHILLDFDMR